MRMMLKSMALIFSITALSSLSQAAGLSMLNEGHHNTDFSFSFSDSDKRDSVWALGVSEQYFIKDDLSIGGAIGLGDTSNSRLQYVLAPSINYYFAHLDSAAPYVQGGLVVAQGSNDDADATGFFGRVGLAYFVTPQIAVKSGLELSHMSYSKYDENTFSLFSAFSIFF